MQWRENDYFNPALAISGGEHLLDTQRILQDHDLILLPQSSVKFFFGYTRNTQTGPALSTAQLFDSRGNEFPLFDNIRRQQNEFRLGGEADFLGFRLNVLHGWDNFKEDTLITANGLTIGNNPATTTQLTSFRRPEPSHGNRPYWRLSLVRDQKRWAVNARYTYVAGHRDFVLDEAAFGTDRFSNPRNLQTIIHGSGNRPSSAGNLTLSLFPTEKLTITNHTAFSNTRMGGDNTFRQLDTGNLLDITINFRDLGIRAMINMTDANYAATKWLGFYAGYHFSNRRIRDTEVFSLTGSTDTQKYEQENNLHSGLAGIRL